MGGLAAGLALLFLAGCGTSGPPPLGVPSAVDSGWECTPGKTLANGTYTLQNSSDQTVTVTSVRLVGGAGQKMTSPAYLIPQWEAKGIDAILGDNAWPVHWPTWHLRKRVPATIAPHKTINLVFAQTRTSDHPTPAGVQVDYSAGGNSYTWTQTFVRVEVGIKC